MKNYLFILFFFLVSLSLAAQKKVWVEPSGNDFDPTKPCELFIDISQCECQRLVGHPGPLYIWTWMPADPVIGNGNWTASNTALEMKNEGGDVWSFEMTPTEFYGVDAATVYQKDFMLLAKALDGTGEGGGGCNEDKTEDQKVTVDPPSTGPRKVFSFPDIVASDNGPIVRITNNDVFSIIYDPKLEKKATMLGATELWVFVNATGTDDKIYKLGPLSKVSDFPQQKMTLRNDGIFVHSLIPARFFAGLLPDGVKIAKIEYQIIKQPLKNSDDAVDGKFLYTLENCE